MANEVYVRSTLQVSSGNVSYYSRPNSFVASLVGTAKGPAPGVVTVTLAGIEVDLSEFTDPGFCRVMNQDATNYVNIGVWVGASFYEVFEIGPGETYTVKLARTLQTTGTPGNPLGLQAVGGVCNVLVEAFER